MQRENILLWLIRINRQIERTFSPCVHLKRDLPAHFAFVSHFKAVGISVMNTGPKDKVKVRAP